jgi:hypothetical protein
VKLIWRWINISVHQEIMMIMKIIRFNSILYLLTADANYRLSTNTNNNNKTTQNKKQKTNKKKKNKKTKKSKSAKAI